VVHGHAVYAAQNVYIVYASCIVRIETETYLMSDCPRTTLFIVEKEEWINAKSIAEKMGYNSVSEYIFDLLKADRQHKISYHSLLLELEKYYELEHYTLGLTADRAGFPEKILIGLMQEFGLPFPERKKQENTDLIHKLLLQNKLCPREVDSFLRLKNELQKRKALADADILCSIFPDIADRTAEVLTITRDLVLEFLENSARSKKPLRQHDSLRNYGEYSDLRALFGRFALEYDAEAIDNDPIIENLRKENNVQLFGRMLEYASLLLIKREMERIESLRLEHIPIIGTKEVDEIKLIVTEQRNRIEEKFSDIAVNQ
jgi:hypothetical protein